MNKDIRPALEIGAKGRKTKEELTRQAEEGVATLEGMKLSEAARIQALAAERAGVDVAAREEEVQAQKARAQEAAKEALGISGVPTGSLAKERTMRAVQERAVRARGYESAKEMRAQAAAEKPGMIARGLEYLSRLLGGGKKSEEERQEDVA